jgi:hypothetical protein
MLARRLPLPRDVQAFSPWGTTEPQNEKTLEPGSNPSFAPIIGSSIARRYGFGPRPSFIRSRMTSRPATWGSQIERVARGWNPPGGTLRGYPGSPRSGRNCTSLGRQPQDQESVHILIFFSPLAAPSPGDAGAWGGERGHRARTAPATPFPRAGQVETVTKSTTSGRRARAERAVPPSKRQSPLISV